MTQAQLRVWRFPLDEQDLPSNSIVWSLPLVRELDPEFAVAGDGFIDVYQHIRDGNHVVRPGRYRVIRFGELKYEGKYLVTVLEEKDL